jgi:uncharacterized protein YjbI with pentapeptide repeats
MSKKILFCSLFILIFLFPIEQDPSAKTWERRNTTVSADSIIAAIDRGDSVIIDSCKIFGPLIKEGTWRRPDTIKSVIKTEYSTIYDSVSFKCCYFNEDVMFEPDTFHGYAGFMYTTFSEYTSFTSATFSGDADFDDATFDGEAFFSEATIGGHGDFRGVIFEDFAGFWRATICGDAYFSGATFARDAYFDEINFEGEPYFNVANFDSDACFREATFGGDANFKGATFKNDAYFYMATFDSNASFSEAYFCGNAYFQEVTFGGYADFSDAIFCRQVDLSPKEFKNMYISWKQLKGHLVYNRTANYKLMKYFEDQRLSDDADGIYLFLKDHERVQKPPYIRYPEYWFIQLTCGYGVKPLRTLVATFLIILVFSVFYTKSNAIREIEKELGHRRRRRKYRIVCSSFSKRFYDALYFSVHTFIIGVVSDWHPTDEFLINTKKIRLFKFRTLSMIEGALGWILLVLFVVTLTRKFIR